MMNFLLIFEIFVCIIVEYFFRVILEMLANGISAILDELFDW